MPKLSSKVINFSYASVALEDELSSVEQSINVELPPVTALSDTGPRRVEGNYDYGYSLEGFFDPAASQGDATLFGRIGSGGAATAFDPTGNAAGAGDPNYDSTSVMLESYNIRGAVGAPVTYSAGLQGNAALARAVA